MDPVLYFASLTRGRLIFAGVVAFVTVVAAVLYFWADVGNARSVAIVGLFVTVASLSDFSGGGGGSAGGGDGGAGGGHGGSCGPGGPC